MGGRSSQKALFGQIHHQCLVTQFTSEVAVAMLHPHPGRSFPLQFTTDVQLGICDAMDDSHPAHPPRLSHSKPDPRPFQRACPAHLTL